MWFLQLKEFLESNPEYPSQKTDRELYQWVAQQRNRKKNGTLKNEEIRKLNLINFAWSIVEWKWNRQFEIFEEYAKSNEFPPCKGIDDDELVKWYKYQQTYIRDGKIISDYQKSKFLSIDRNFAGPSSRKKWLEPYRELVTFREENPDKWPQYNREEKDSIESRLNVFCQTMRKRYRENDLGNYWFDKLTKIDFNFEGRTDNWTKYFEEVQFLLSNKKSVSAEEIGNKTYSWVLRHKKKLDEGTLSEYQTKKVQSLNLDQFFVPWEEKYERVKAWVKENDRLPTKTTNDELHIWLASQRIRYKNGTLSDEEIDKIKNLGYDLEAKGLERFEEKWLAQFNEYKEFLNQNQREPSYGIENERQLYIWVQSQRAARAGRNRKPLPQKRIDLLDSINFKWVGEGVGGGETWEERFQDFCLHIKPNGKLVLPSRINGQRNPLYSWWINQNIAFEKGELSSDRIQQFQNVKIELGKSENNSVQDGFTKWSNKLHEIADFINKNGQYPRAGKDNEQRNLYQSLARTKRAFKNNELSEKQLELLKELNIGISENNSVRDGFTKWSNKLHEIADFINKNGQYPRAGKDNEQRNLYQSLARTKRAFKNNELSEKQLELLKELNIGME